MKKFLFLLAPLFITSANLASEENKEPEIVPVSPQYLNSPAGRMQYKNILQIASDTIDAKHAANKAKEAAASEEESEEKNPREEDKD